MRGIKRDEYRRIYSMEKEKEKEVERWRGRELLLRWNDGGE